MRLPTETGVYLLQVAIVDGVLVPTQALIVACPGLTMLSTMIGPPHALMRDVGMGLCKISDVMHETVLN